MIFELRAFPLPQPEEKAYWFVCTGDKLLVEHTDKAANIPLNNSLLNQNDLASTKLYLGRLDGHPCFAVDGSNIDLTDSSLSAVGLRQLFGMVEDELFWLAARAYHLINWSRNNQYCGRCGNKTDFRPTEHSKLCPNCGMNSYPKISPAVIVAVIKENRILLAKNVNNTTGMYSVLAGFVEPGENLEDCVHREIKEEAGIEVKNIKYFGSQPWPFPDSLMLGFTAEYSRGELILDKTELSDAGWYTADELPLIPGKLSISRKLIDWFVENYKKAACE